MNIKDWINRHCRFAQANANPLDALRAVMDEKPETAASYVKSNAAVYAPRTVKFPTGKVVNTITLNGEIYIVEYDPSFPEIEEAKVWLSNLYDHYLEEYIPAPDFNKTFWAGVGGGSTLYHATSKEFLPQIMQEGLSPMNKTRGMSNRGVGNAIFTSPEPTSIDSYGDTVLEINVGAMKAAGYMPAVSQESPFEAENQKSAIAHKLGIQDWIGGEYGSEGLADDTIIFYGAIPPQFISPYGG